MVVRENSCSLPAGKVINIAKPREMENISRGPIFGDFVTILTEEGSMQGNTVVRLQSTRVKTSLPSLLNVMYCVRVSLRTVKIFLAQH
jgi:hypothetical protein